jgi:hypothetical protein
VFEESNPRILPEPKDSRKDDGSDFASYRRTQQLLLKSPQVLAVALQDQEAANLGVIKKQADPKTWLEKNVEAVFLDGSNVLRIRATAGSPEEQAVLANAVARAYMEEVVHRELQRKRDRHKMLLRIATKYEADLREMRKKLQDLAMVPRADVSGSFSGQLAREDLAYFRRELRETQATHIKDQARINALTAAKVGEASKAALAKLTEEVAVLAEQEKLLQQKVNELERTVTEADQGQALAGAQKEEIMSKEQMARKIRDQAEALQAEIDGPPRVRWLDKAVAPRGK